MEHSDTQIGFVNVFNQIKNECFGFHYCGSHYCMSRHISNNSVIIWGTLLSILLIKQYLTALTDTIMRLILGTKQRSSTIKQNWKIISKYFLQLIFLPVFHSLFVTQLQLSSEYCGTYLTKKNIWLESNLNLTH